MSMLLLPLIAIAAPAAAAPLTDQTADALRVLQFVEALRRDAPEEARAMLTPTAFLGDYAQTKREGFEAFAAYGRGCQLKQISLVNVRDNRRMPVGVEWQCRHPEANRSASFWFERDRISRIGWGPPAIVRVPAVKRQR
jgi:hypothetical protein